VKKWRLADPQSFLLISSVRGWGNFEKIVGIFVGKKGGQSYKMGCFGREGPPTQLKDKYWRGNRNYRNCLSLVQTPLLKFLGINEKISERF
jgi:hypothetical protein